MGHKAMSEPALQLDNPFWRFSLRVYATPGVEAECLNLQDESSADVNLVLFAAWLGAERGARLQAEESVELRVFSQRWQKAAVRPVRQARKAVKQVPELVHAEVQAFRRQLAATELEAERIEQAMLFAMAQRFPQSVGTEPRESAVRHNLDLLLAPKAGAANCPALVAAALAGH